MTLQQLIARTRFFIDEPSQQNFLDSDIISALNRGQEEVTKEINHVYQDYFEKQADLRGDQATPGTVAGTELYALPSDFLYFKRIERTDTGELIPALNDVNEKTSYSTALMPLILSGGSLSYYVQDTAVGFTPTPATSIPIRLTYVYRLPDMVLTTDTSAIPSEHHDLMAIYAAIECFIKDESDTSQFQNLWDQKLGRLVRTLRQRQIQEPKHVRRVDVGGILY